MHWLLLTTAWLLIFDPPNGAAKIHQMPVGQIMGQGQILPSKADREPQEVM